MSEPTRTGFFLDHILQAVDQIQQYVAGQDQATFLADRPVVAQLLAACSHGP